MNRQRAVMNELAIGKFEQAVEQVAVEHPSVAAFLTALEKIV